MPNAGHHRRIARSAEADYDLLWSMGLMIVGYRSNGEAVPLSLDDRLAALPSEHASLGPRDAGRSAVIKIFSIASVLFLPPTLVASVCGMTFKSMPELEWMFGYPSSIPPMIMSAVIPFFFFRWEGWL